MRFFSFFSSLVCILSLSTGVNAQCNVSDFQSRAFDSISLVQQIAFLHTVDETNYEEAKQSASASALVPAGFFSGDYSEFKQLLSRYSATFDYASHLDSHRTWSESALSPEGLAAYKACTLASGGFQIFTVALSDDALRIEIVWDARGDRDAREAPEIVQAVNLSEGKRDELQSLLGRRAWRNSSKSFEFVLQKADPSADAYVTVKNSGSSRSAFFPAPIALPEPPSLRRVCSCKGDSSDPNLVHVRTWGPEGEKCYGQDGWSTYNDFCKAPNTTLASCIGAPGSSVIGTMFFGPDGEPCAGFSTWYPHGVGEDRNPWYGPNRNLLRFSQVDTRWCPCLGEGPVLSGKALWGPEGEDCGGQPGWSRKYTCE